MKKAIYLILLLLVACGHNEETIKETDEMTRAVRKVLDSKKSEKQTTDFWLNAYSNLGITLEKLKKADSEVIEVTKEAKELFEELYIFKKDNEVSAENFVKLLSYTANTVNSKGTTLPDTIKQNNVEQKHLIDKYVKLNFHLDQLEIKLCNKYQINCKTKTPDKPDQQKETKSN